MGIQGPLWDPCLVLIWTQEAGVFGVEFKRPSVSGAREGVCRSDKREGQGDVSSFWFPFLPKGRNFVPSKEGNFAEPEGLAVALNQAACGLESFHFPGNL